jgi:DNA-directed RNA polymerase omega subunit
MVKQDYILTEKLLGASQGSVYKLTVLAAKRALELAEEEQALIEKPQRRFVDTALLEIAQGKIKVKQQEDS